MKPHEGTAVTPDTRVDIDSSPKPDLLIQVAPGSINIKRCFWELQWRNRLARGTYMSVLGVSDAEVVSSILTWSTSFFNSSTSFLVFSHQFRSLHIL